MSSRLFSGTANITHDGIKKEFNRWKKEPLQPIVELVANGFDAKASRVDVTIEYNGLDGVAYISVLDNGTGINVNKCSEHFEKFNDSLKKDDDDTQGAHGRGRLAFHLICNNATWYTKLNKSDTGIISDAKVSIVSNNIRDYEGTELIEGEQHSLISLLDSGTCVELTNFTKNIPSIDKVKTKLQSEFGWRLALNSSRELYLNGDKVDIPEHQLIDKVFSINDVDFQVKFIHWFTKPGREKNYNYLINSDGKVVYRETNSFNLKGPFYLSTYSGSDWVKSFDPLGGGLSFDNRSSPHSKVYKDLQREITQFSRSIYDDFQRKHVDKQIELYVEKGYFPRYKNLSTEESAWRLKNTKKAVKNIYLSEPAVFSNLSAKPAKVLIGLLDRILISNENDSLFEVLESVLDLEKSKINVLAEQLKLTSLDNVVCTIEELQKREAAVCKLKELMLIHYKEVLETPDLQLIIEKNTWLFGNQYSIIGAEEDDFQKTAYKLRSHIKNIDLLEEDDFDEFDLAEGLKIEGVRRQVDLFLAGQKLEFDSQNREYLKCTIIEIKRPSVALNSKHLKQLNDYARIISQHPGFSHINMKFELILVGRKISNADFDIGAAFEAAEGYNEPGLVLTYGKGAIKGYVKTWATIFNEFEISNNYLLRQLKTKRKGLENSTSAEIVNSLQNN